MAAQSLLHFSGGPPRDTLVATGGVAIGTFHILTSNTDTVLKVSVGTGCGIHIEQIAEDEAIWHYAILRCGLRTTGDGLASTAPQSGPGPCAVFRCILPAV